MTRLIALALALFALAATRVDAKCPYRPQVFSKVTIFTCQHVTFEAAVSKGELPLLNHRAGQKVSGVCTRMEETDLVWARKPSGLTIPQQLLLQADRVIE